MPQEDVAEDIMGIKDISWDMFAMTGDIKLFLLYKRLDDGMVYADSFEFARFRPAEGILGPDGRPGEGPAYEKSEFAKRDNEGTYNTRDQRI